MISLLMCQPRNHEVPSEGVKVLNPVDSSESAAMRSQMPNATQFSISESEKLEKELKEIGIRIGVHERHIKHLNSLTNQLDESIIDLQGALGKYVPSLEPESEGECPTDRASEQETVEQILKHDKSAAALVVQLKTRHASYISSMMLMQDVIGVVAMLGKLEDTNLSRLLSEFLGLETVLGLVCKSHDTVKAIESYDREGLVNRESGIHGLGATIGRSLGRFLVISLENLRPYAGEFLDGDPQRRLDIPKPKLANGEIAPGFLGYAVNMITIDRRHLYCLTSDGCGLRETLFYNLFSRLQVYRSREDMLLALPCISDGAVSLDGGMMRTNGVFSLGSGYEVDVRFPKGSPQFELPEHYFEIEKQIMQKKWEKERLQEDVRVENQLLGTVKKNFQAKKSELVRCIAKGQAYLTQLNMQQGAHHRQAPHVVHQTQ